MKKNIFFVGFSLLCYLLLPILIRTHERGSFRYNYQKNIEADAAELFLLFIIIICFKLFFNVYIYSEYIVQLGKFISLDAPEPPRGNGILPPEYLFIRITVQKK